MFLLILIWGGPRRVYAAWKFLLFTIAASALLLLAILILYFKGGHSTFDMQKLQSANIPGAVSGVLFWLFFLCFAIKLPAFPFHTWLPDAHVEAPTAVSVLLAGILLKMGGYGMIRICVGFFPGAAKYYSMAILALAVIGILWGGFAALVQDDMKRMVAYSSVSHMGFVLLGMSALTPLALNGAVFQLFAHGVITGRPLPARGAGLRPHPHPLHPRARRPGATNALPDRGLGDRRAGGARPAGLRRLHRRVRDLPRQLQRAQGRHLPGGVRRGAVGRLPALDAGAGLLRPLKEAWNKLKDPGPVELGYMVGMLFVIFVIGVLPRLLTQMINLGVAPIATRAGGG